MSEMTACPAVSSPSSESPGSRGMENARMNSRLRSSCSRTLAWRLIAIVSVVAGVEQTSGTLASRQRARSAKFTAILAWVQGEHIRRQLACRCRRAIWCRSIFSMSAVRRSDSEPGCPEPSRLSLLSSSRLSRQRRRWPSAPLQAFRQPAGCPILLRSACSASVVASSGSPLSRAARSCWSRGAESTARVWGGSACVGPSAPSRRHRCPAVAPAPSPPSGLTRSDTSPRPGAAPRDRPPPARRDGAPAWARRVQQFAFRGERHRCQDHQPVGPGRGRDTER